LGWGLLGPVGQGDLGSHCPAQPQPPQHGPATAESGLGAQINTQKPSRFITFVIHPFCMKMNENELQANLRLLQEKFRASGQDMNSYLQGLMHSNYLTYWDYIHLDTLLTLQQPKTAFPDEKIFILYHQITELYFKLCLNELEQIPERSSDADFLLSRLKRLTAYFSALTHSFQIMIEGMEPEQFLQFRMALLPASGFQSAQYRMIEIRATPLQNLLQFELRESTEAAGSTTELLENIYWGRGAAELLTGNKTLTLKQFEAKYGAEFLRLAEEMKGKTLYEVFQGLPDSDRQRTDLREALRTFDRQVNIDWPLMHYKSAVRYLKREPEDIAATGGTNWQKYLAPKNQMRIFFPELWTEQERKEWGRH